jgi:hypothetical protein
MRYIQGEDKLMDFLRFYEDGTPPLLVSNGFPRRISAKSNNTYPCNRRETALVGTKRKVPPVQGYQVQQILDAGRIQPCHKRRDLSALFADDEFPNYF